MDGRQTIEDRRRHGFLAGLPLAIVVAFVAPPARGAETERPVTVVLDVSPSAEPRPALKYRLLPPPAVERGANAAPIYCKAAMQLNSIDAAEWKRIDAWLTTPVADLPREEIRALLDQRSMALDCLRIASRREKCEWDPPLEESQNFWLIPLPEMQELQRGSRLVAVKARLEIAEGKTEQVVDTLSTGFAMSRHLASCPFLVCAMMGQAAATRMLEQLETFIQTERSPNFYWNLSSLPDPLIDVRRPLELESECLLKNAKLDDVDQGARSNAQWRRLLIATLEMLHDAERLETAGKSTGDKPNTSVADRLAAALAATSAARAGLIEAGRDPEKVAKMSDPEAVLVYSVFDYRCRRDSQFKWLALPSWQASEGLRALKDGAVNARPEMIPLASLTLPAVATVLVSNERLGQRIAALRTIEALRLHAAAHNGTLPTTLEAIVEAPAPVDPATGKLFRYTASSDRATLSGEAISLRGKQSLLQYEIRVKPAKH